jgi:hypothetical protein
MNTLAISTAAPSVQVAPASSDQQLVDLWLHSRTAHTQRAYRADSDRSWASRCSGR